MVEAPLLRRTTRTTEIVLPELQTIPWGSNCCLLGTKGPFEGEAKKLVSKGSEIICQGKYGMEQAVAQCSNGTIRLGVKNILGPPVRR